MSNELVFRLIFMILFLSGTTVSIYHRRKAEQAGGEKVSLKEESTPIRISLRVGGLILWITMIAWMINPAWVAWSRIDLPDPLRWAAAGLALASWGLVIWMFRTLGKNITPTVVTRQEHSLVTDGPYRWIRHPLYSFATLFYISLGLVAANGLIPVLSILAFVLLAIRTSKEEEKLLEKFGDRYRVYMEQTGRFVPRFR